MKKTHKFNEMSNVTCPMPGCTNKIKQRILEQKEKPSICFACHVVAEKNRGHVMQLSLPKNIHRPTLKRITVA